MKKADFLKAARAAAPHIDAQIVWLESQDYGDHDQAWMSALEVLDSERSALWTELDGLKERYAALEEKKNAKAFAAMSAMSNAAQTARDGRWDMDDIENQIAVYRMATDEDAINSLMD